MNKSNVLHKLCYRSGLYLKHHSSTILTCMGVAGVVGTAIMVAKASPKANKLLDKATYEKGEELTKAEIIQTAGPVYIPAIVMGAATITCILGANVLNQKKQAALTSAYALIDSSYKEYRNKLKELYGEEADQKIRDAIAIEKAKDIRITSECLCSNCDLAVDTDGERVLFYDEWTKRYFESTIEQVLSAEYHLNRNFTLGGCCMLNMFYEFLGLEPTPEGEVIGWCVMDEFYWIDFNHRKVQLEDGMECYIIETMYEPSTEWQTYY